MSELLLIAAMRIEAAALRRGAPHAEVRRIGMGARRARRAAVELAGVPAGAIAVAGFGGGLSCGLRGGDLVVATELRTPDGNLVAECPAATGLADELNRRHVRASAGPLVTVSCPAAGSARAALAATGALAADMESAWLVPVAGARPFVVVRAVLDRSGGELWNPAAMVTAFRPALRALRVASAVLVDWASAPCLDLRKPR